MTPLRLGSGTTDGFDSVTAFLVLRTGRKWDSWHFILGSCAVHLYIIGSRPGKQRRGWEMRQSRSTIQPLLVRGLSPVPQSRSRLPNWDGSFHCAAPRMASVAAKDLYGPATITEAQKARDAGQPGVSDLGRLRIVGTTEPISSGGVGTGFTTPQSGLDGGHDTFISQESRPTADDLGGHTPPTPNHSTSIGS
jgi:hypothetical protein